MGGDDTPEGVVRGFLDAFVRGDEVGMRARLDDGLVGRVTAADGGTNRLSADQYVAAVAAMDVAAMDVATANLRVAVNDVTGIGDRTVLVMVEVHAARDGRTLHNFSGQLATVADGRITELSMVDALPEESDRFWSA